VLAGALVLYLGLDGGGYDIIVRSQTGMVVWWIVLVGAVWGILPTTRPTGAAWAAMALFGGVVLWTALASTWSLSTERSLQELSRVACYLGVLLLALAIHRDRGQAVRHTVNAVAAAIVVVVALALASRLVPSSFPAAQTTAAFLGGAQARLSWPLNYWNGLAALIALGLPLLLSIATSARALLTQAAAAAAIPLLALCGYLTASRGGAIAAGVALLAFLVLAPDRFPKLATMLIAAAGSALLITSAAHRSAIQRGLTDHGATVQGGQVIVTIVLVCVAVALAQVGIGLAARHGTLPRLLRVPRRRARALLAGGVAVALIAAVSLGAPSRLSRAWTDFKHPHGAAGAASLGARFDSFSGNGRYQYWKVAVQATSGRRLTGSGPGTFQLLWQPRATVSGYVVNAHSLYVETLAELGVIGLALLAAFFLLVVAVAVRLVRRSKYEERTRAAGAVAALLAFAVSAAVDWVWQLPVLPTAFLLLAAAVLAPAGPVISARATAAGAAPASPRGTSGRARLVLRAGIGVIALACLVAVAVPLATASRVRQSQAAFNAGNSAVALAAARSATRIEPGAASAQLQVALVLESQHRYLAAVIAARNATRDEPLNWNGWLILSRLEAESGHVTPSVAAYRHARSLNPRSLLFPQ
jgi:hypothetical protein